MTLTEEFSKAVHDLRALAERDMVMFVLRHAESAGQKQQELYKTLGDNHLPITSLGVRQANAAGQILARLIDAARLENVRLISSTGHRSTRTMVEIFRSLDQDTYVNVAGGFEIDEPATDLGVVAALLSSQRNVPLRADVAVFGEVGLLGEVRSVSQADLRAREAAALGFRRIVVPHGNASEIRADMDVTGIRRIEEFPAAIF